MSIKVWIGEKEFENTHEFEMARDVIACLRDCYEELDEICHILINPSIPIVTKKGKPSSPDLIVLKSTSLIVVELKKYNYAITSSDNKPWISHTPEGDKEVDGGKKGRTPFGQVRDYRGHLNALLENKWTDFLSSVKQKEIFDIKKFISTLVLCPPLKGERRDECQVDTAKIRWFSFVRMDQFAEVICSTCSGRDSKLSEREIEDLITNVLKLEPAHLVGNMPKRGKKEVVVNPRIVEKVVEKIVRVEKTIEVEKPVFISTSSDYDRLLTIYEIQTSNEKKIHSFSELFRFRITEEANKRFKDAIVRDITTKAMLLFKDSSDELLEHITRFSRLVARTNKGCTASLEDVNESFKTLCGVLEKFNPDPLPKLLREKCDAIAYRQMYATIDQHKRGEYFRLEVKNVDKEKHTFVGVDHSDGGVGVEYFVDYSEDEPAHVKSYDKSIYDGATVSVVTPKSDGTEVLHASEIILTPDYLLSPKEIGNCAEYNHPGLYFWLNLIKPIESNVNFLIGDYANICLENFAHHLDKSRIDVQSHFWRQKSVSIAAEAFTEGDKKQLKVIYDNLNTFFTQTLPNEIGEDSGVAWQIEAPLYAPSLGLSARADAIAYTSRQGATVIELKAAKWDDFRGADAAKYEHIFQPSLYKEVLFFSQGIPRKNVVALLYYSKPSGKYSTGRLFVNPKIVKDQKIVKDWQFVRKFAYIRNQILSVDRFIRDNDIRQVFEKLKPESFKNANWSDNYWSHKCSNIKQILFAIQNQNECNKAYFYRMLKFIADESFLARVGGDGVGMTRGGISTLWRSPVEVRKNNGLRLSQLKIITPIEFVDGSLIQTLKFSLEHDEANTNTSLRQGDGVSLYLDSAEANITNSIVFNAIIEDLSPSTITVRLTDKQQKVLFHEAAFYAIEASPMASMKDYQALWYFLTGDSYRISLILNEKKPRVEGGLLPMDLKALESRYSGVSEWIQNAWNARDWYLLWGPPGTGKTSHAMSALVDVAMKTPGMRILLLAYTNRATDEICKMLEKRLKVANNLEDYIRIGNREKSAPELRGKFIDNLDCRNKLELLERIEKTRIFVSTVSSLTPSNVFFKLVPSIDLAIVDEASQLLDIHLLPLFCAKLSDNTPLIKKFILVGDDKQLPAVVQQSKEISRIEDELLVQQGFENCRESLFSRFKRIAGEDKTLIGMLDHHFRMHPTIAEFCNVYFYDGKLKTGGSAHQGYDLPKIPKTLNCFEQYVLSQRFGFIPVQKTRGKLEDLKVNTVEAQVCIDIIKALLKYDATFDDNGKLARPYYADEIIIIVPFRNQIATIKKELLKVLSEEEISKVVIDTVERNQGSGRKVVIFSTVIQYEFQKRWISDCEDEDEDEENKPIDQKLNVAITRAEERFYIVGNQETLSHLRCYHNLLDWIYKKGGVFEEEDLFF